MSFAADVIREQHVRHQLAVRRMRMKAVVQPATPKPVEVKPLFRVEPVAPIVEPRPVAISAAPMDWRSPITIATVAPVVVDVTGPMEPMPTFTPTLFRIRAVVAAHFGISVADITGSNRRRGIVWPRQIAMALARELTTLSYPQIGRRFGGKDHTTVVHAARQVMWRMDTDPAVAALVAELRAAVAGGGAA